MYIPPKFEEKLKLDQALFGSVLMSIKEFEPLYNMSGIPFFPDYTDHGLKHIEEVLNTIEALIPEKSWAFVSSGDIACIILATLLHDVAMHLSEDGFVSLIQNNHEDGRITELDDKPWDELWEEFIAEAKRFDGRKLINIFGDTEPIRRPNLNPQDMTRRDRLLIGEFIRRYHHRLAHEIAITGFPGGDLISLKLKEVPDDISNLAGLVARSHGEPIRASYQYLEKLYDLRAYKDVHVIYLMVLLRISDYLQIQASRAPSQLLKVKRIKSPISKREWDVHNSIRDIRTVHEDPEAIFIDLLPTNVKSFLQIKKWLGGIQSELDISWAILGEIYGRFEELNQLWVSIRRVRSSLDNPNEFSTKLDYIPLQVSFEVANPDLMKLLIKPLYGDHPEFGIRELIQNAVDAVLELREYMKQNNLQNISDLKRQETDIVLSIETRANEEKWICVSDNGIGMDEDVIQNYYLKAGASFRQSESWAKSFMDEKGNSKVLRSGRFGVGVLACFLLGDEIEVETRHVKNKKGIRFRAKLDAESIELKKIKCAIGTKISIKLNIELPKMSLPFYLPYPTFGVIQKDGTINKLNGILPSDDLSLDHGWHQISHVDYEKVFWSYNHYSNLYCNGFIIDKYAYGIRRMYGRDKFEDKLHTWNSFCEYSFPFEVPAISVMDPDGKFPLDLQRTEMTINKLPFDEELRFDIIKQFFIRILCSAPEHSLLDIMSRKWYFDEKFKGLELSDNQISNWISTPKGISLLNDWHLDKCDVERILIIPNDKNNNISFQLDKYHWQALAGINVSSNSKNETEWPWFFRKVFIRKNYLQRNTFRIIGARVIIKKSVATNMLSSLPISVRNKLKIIWEDKTWQIIASTNSIKGLAELKELIHNEGKDAIIPVLVAEWLLPREKNINQLSPLTYWWNEILKTSIIPYEFSQRKNIIAEKYKDIITNIAPYKFTQPPTITGKKNHKPFLGQSDNLKDVVPF